MVVGLGNGVIVNDRADVEILNDETTATPPDGARAPESYGMLLA